MEIRNLGITRTIAIVAAIVGGVGILGAIAIAAIIWGVNDAGPVLTAILAAIGGLFPALVAALKATEAADTVSQFVERLEKLDGALTTLRSDVDAMKARPYPFGSRREAGAT